MADYRVRILSSEAAADGDVHLDCYIQRDDEGEWVDTLNGHRTMVMDGEAVLAITEGSGTEVEKRTALLALFKAEAEAWGIDQADDANLQLVALLPTGWPVNVNL